jgi:predicted HicB family RNase H-like nuclease
MVTKPNPRRHVQDAELERRIEAFAQEAVTATVVRPAKEAATVGFNFKMTPTNHARLKRMAEHEGRSLQNLLNTLVWPALTELESEKQW